MGHLTVYMFGYNFRLWSIELISSLSDRQNWFCCQIIRRNVIELIEFYRYCLIELRIHSRMNLLTTMKTVNESINRFLSRQILRPKRLSADKNFYFHIKLWELKYTGFTQCATFFWAICILHRVPFLTSKAVFHHLYQNILAFFTVNCPLFSKWAKKPIFYQKFHFYFFREMSPMCNTFLGSLGDAHWVHPV